MQNLGTATGMLIFNWNTKTGGNKKKKIQPRTLQDQQNLQSIKMLLMLLKVGKN